MSNIYSIYSDHTHGGVIQTADSLDHSYMMLSRHNIGKKLEVEFEPEFAIDDEDEVVGDEFDLSVAASPFLIISEMAHNVLRGTIGEDVQYFRLSISGSNKVFYGLHPLKCFGIEAVNVDECRSVRHYEKGAVINGVVFKSNFEPRANIFVIKGSAGVYASEDLRRKVSEEKLNSFEFRLMKRV